MPSEQTRGMLAASQRQVEKLKIILEDRDELIREKDREIALLRGALLEVLGGVEEVARGLNMNQLHAKVRALRELPPLAIQVRIADC